MSKVDGRLIAGIVLGAILIALFAATLDLPKVGAALRAAHPAWIGLAAFLILGEWWIRGFRWQGLIQHVDPDVPAWTLVSATVIGAATNTLLPLRGGDLLRPAIVAGRRHLRFATLLSSTVVERMFDVLGLSVIFTAMLVVMPADTLASAEAVLPVRKAGYLLCAFGVATLLSAILLATDTAKAGVVAVLSRLPMGQVLSRFYADLVEGIRPVRSPFQLGRAAFFTALLWGNGLLAIVCVFRAFDLDIPVAAALFVDVAIALAVVVPQAPGFVGVFHVVLETTLRLWGANVAVAQAAAIVFWACCFVPVTVWGLFEAYRAGIGLLDRPAPPPAA